MEYVVLNIAKDYTETPGARKRNQGKYSGEDFLETKLIPEFKKAQAENKQLLVDLDGCYGFLLSFIDEAFGGLTLKFGKRAVDEVLKVECKDEKSLLETINTVIEEWEKKRKSEGGD